MAENVKKNSTEKNEAKSCIFQYSTLLPGNYVSVKIFYSDRVFFLAEKIIYEQ